MDTSSHYAPCHGCEFCGRNGDEVQSINIEIAMIVSKISTDYIPGYTDVLERIGLMNKTKCMMCQLIDLDGLKKRYGSYPTMSPGTLRRSIATKCIILEKETRDKLW